METLERNEVERPKVLAKKTLVFSDMSEQIDKLPEVKETIDAELRKRSSKEIRKYLYCRKAYNELLNYINRRYKPKDKMEELEQAGALVSFDNSKE